MKTFKDEYRSKGLLPVAFMIARPLTDALYTFVETNGEPVHIASTYLLEILKRSGAVPALCLFDATLIQALERGDLGAEGPHALKLPEAALDAPGIVGRWGDRHIMIDGAHRLWRRWQRGDTDFPAYYLTEDIWRRFTVDGIPGDGAFWSDHNSNAKVR